MRIIQESQSDRALAVTRLAQRCNSIAFAAKEILDLKGVRVRCNEVRWLIGPRVKAFDILETDGLPCPSRPFVTYVTMPACNLEFVGGVFAAACRVQPREKFPSWKSLACPS